MGSPAHCYKEFVREYIRLNSYGNKYRAMFKDESIDDLSVEEMEKIAKGFNNSNPLYRAYLGGVAVANCLEEFCNDEVNAAMCMIEPFEELLGVKSSQVSEISEVNQTSDGVVESWSKEKLSVLENLVEQAMLIVDMHIDKSEGKNICEKDIYDSLDVVKKHIISLKSINKVEDD